MNTVTELYTPEALACLRRKNLIRIVVLAALSCAVLTACIVLCAMIGTLNAGAMQWRIVTVSVLGGWAALAFWFGVVLPGRREAAHQSHMLEGERECDEGLVTVLPQLLRIPKSAPLLRAELRDGERLRHLTVSPNKAALLGPTPRRMKVRTVFGCIVAWEASDAGDPPLPGADAAPAARAKIRRARNRDRIRRCFFLLPLFILWALLSAVLWSWIVGLVTDVPPSKKVTLYLDVPAVEDAALSAALEEALPEGLKMVRAHSFSYVLFQQDALRSADLYVLPASEMEDFAAGLLPLDAPAAEDVWSLDGTVYGLRCYEAGTSSGAAAEYVRYPAAEDHYICINKDSAHIADGAAMRIAQRYLELKEPRPGSSGTGTADVLPEGFILGMDLSSVLAEEAGGVRYRDFDGTERDIFQLLSENGLTHVRVRVWNDPFDSRGRGYGGGNCDVNCAAEIGRRAAAAGLKLIVDFHYSDFWADPGKQAVPKAWEGMTAEQKADALYDFTCESLRTVMNAGADVAMVQIGNETNQFLCGERSWDAVALLMRSGAQAVRDACPGALVALHFTNPERPGAYADYARQLADRGVDYDVFASSWYPYWHGSLENLSAVLAEVAETWGKSVMVMETSYAYTADDTDFFGNTVGAGAEAGWPFTVEGQADAVRAVINAVAQMKNGIGVVYWEGAWISAGGGSWAENSALWERFGSGWASSFAAEYDPADAGKYYGGCAVDNQALFGPDGTALESLRVFRARQ